MRMKKMALYILEQEVCYDDSECDGYCLLDDITDYLIEKGYIEEE